MSWLFVVLAWVPLALIVLLFNHGAHRNEPDNEPEEPSNNVIDLECDRFCVYARRERFYDQVEVRLRFMLPEECERGLSYLTGLRLENQQLLLGNPPAREWRA